MRLEERRGGGAEGLDAVAAVRANFAEMGRTLSDLIAIAGISASSFPREEMRRSADAVAEVMLWSGFSDVGLLETDGHPAVYGEMRGPAGAPSVLVYGHHDVQPPGRTEAWTTPPFEASVRDGRIYGRGAADDKGGFLAYIAAARAFGRELPCTVKMLIEGEEEIGSPNLPALLTANRQKLAAGFVVLCDTPNFDTGVPSLTYRLRGNCIVDVEVRCTDRPVHSGQAGGVVPDATMILCSLLVRLHDSDGNLRIRGLDERVTVDDAQLAAIRGLTFDEARIRRHFAVRDGVRLLASSFEQIWARPSLAITALESVPVARAANQITDVARARLSLRTVRDLDTRAAGELLADALRSDPPFGAEVTVNIVGGPSWWEADPRHPIFGVARRALGRAFGREAVMMGSGGSIGFVKPFADLFPDTPLLLTGVQDPRSNAHSENESLHLGDWEKAMLGAVHLFEDLAAMERTAA